MSCCGEKRQNWQHKALSYEKKSPADLNPVIEIPVLLKFSGSSTLLVKGDQTGNIYLFAPGDAPMAVDSRDLKGILAASSFITLPDK